MLSGDLRHYFHQIGLAPFLQKYFGVHCLGKIFAYSVLPMGWSHSPRIAQSFAWAALLSQAPVKNGLSKAAETLLKEKPEHPPSFLLLHDSQGLVVGLTLIWYDNFIAWSTNADIAIELSKSWASLTPLYGIVWGEKQLWHPTHLAVNLTDVQSDKGVALGIQFARQVKRGRDEDPDHLVWRLKPKTAQRAKELLIFNSEGIPLSLIEGEWSCRRVAGVVGSSVWQCYVSCEPLATIHEALELSSRLGRHAQKHGWNSSYGMSISDKEVVKTTLIHLMANPWFGASKTRDWDQIRIIATDASLVMGAWVRYSGKDSRADWNNWLWTGLSLLESIFILELRSAIEGIKLNGVRDGILVLITDNTACAAVLRALYSSTALGRELLKDLHDFIKRENIFLIVTSIAGVDNDADSPTRGLKERPAWCPRRLEVTWSTAIRAIQGCDRLRLNPASCGISHFQDDTFTSESNEDEDCEHLAASVDRLMQETCLDTRL